MMTFSMRDDRRSSLRTVSSRFPAYLQQLMESNGKHVTLDGTEGDYQTGPVYWVSPALTDSTLSTSSSIRAQD